VPLSVVNLISHLVLFGYEITTEKNQARYLRALRRRRGLARHAPRLLRRVHVRSPCLRPVRKQLERARRAALPERIQLLRLTGGRANHPASLRSKAPSQLQPNKMRDSSLRLLLLAVSACAGSFGPKAPWLGLGRAGCGICKPDSGSANMYL